MCDAIPSNCHDCHVLTTCHVLQLTLSSTELLAPLDQDVPQVLGGDDASLLRVHPSECLQQLLRNRLLLGVAVHDVKEVGEGDLPALVLDVVLELGDGGRHAQGPHDHRQLVHGSDVA